MKLKYFTILFLGALALASCKKDRDCECAGYTVAGVDVPAQTYTYAKSKKKDAQEACDAASATWEAAGSDGCTLK